MKAIILITLVFVFSTGCKKEKTAAYKNNFNVSTTAGTWSASSVSAALTANAIVITAGSSNTDKIDFYISKDISAGAVKKIASAASVPGDNELANCFYTIGSFTMNAKLLQDWAKVSVEITENNTANRTIKGKFLVGGLVLFTDNSNSSVTGGNFDCKY